MKKSTLLLGLIFLFSILTVQGQIVIKYQQGFEATGETYGYTVTGGNVVEQSTIVSSGEQSLQMEHGTTTSEFVTDMMDFTDNGGYQYFVLEFMHICDVEPWAASSPDYVATVWAKLAGETQWTQLTGTTHYDRNWGGGTSEFESLSTFNTQSYPLWGNGTVNNTWWKKERFNLSQFFSGVAVSNRRLQIKFVLQPKVDNTPAGAWYIDGITVKASVAAMVAPRMTMLAYPDFEEYPSSRGARVALDLKTSAAEGMNRDSCYAQYILGTNGTIQKQLLSITTTGSGTGTIYHATAYIPFCGYDTIVRYRIIAKDASTNQNEVTFPTDASGWEHFRCVRGYANYASLSNSLSNVSDYPFSSNGDSRCQFVYDSATLAAAGYRAGAMTSISFTAGSNTSNAIRNSFKIKMCNVDSSFVVTTDPDASQVNYYTNEMKTVYNDQLPLSTTANTISTINFQDTFYYAGKDILMMMTCDNTSTNPSSTSVKCFPTVANKQTLYTGFDASLGFDPETNGLFETGQIATKRPNFMFNAIDNAPLLYDCGIAAIISPSDSTPATAGNANNNTVILRLANYGANPINAVKLWYQVDTLTPQYFNWSGTLAGGDSVNVTVNTTQHYAAGFHYMTAWVDDTVTSSGARYRDHEPYNDTIRTTYISCAGAMSSEVQVGGAGANYANLNEFLYAVGQCGVNGPLTVKLAPGIYPPVTIPNIPGISARNYVLFEPMDGSDTSVTFLPIITSGATTPSLVDIRSTGHIRFNKINFVSNATTSPVTYFVRMSSASTACRFTNCLFREDRGSDDVALTYTFADALIFSGGADSVLVQNCRFLRGTVGVSLIGPSTDNHARGNRIIGNTFTNQGNSAVVVRNQYAALVDTNTIDDVLTNTSYEMLVQDCSGPMRIVRNKLYVSTGAGCIGVSSTNGTASNYAVIANNMLVSHDDGLSNSMTTPLNIISGTYTKFVYNSIKMIAQERVGIAAAAMGGGVLNNCYFYNNIVSCEDTANYAFSYLPSGTNVNHVDYNIYYSTGSFLNRYNGTDCLTLAAWQANITDGHSQQANPAFTNGMRVDLRTYSLNVQGHGTPVSEVSTDMFGNSRGATQTCVGAFEFPALQYEFEVAGMEEPYSAYCDVPTSAPLRVVLKNNGTNNFVPGGSTVLTLYYSRTTQPGVLTPGHSGSLTINRSIPAGDTIIFNTGANLQFPVVGQADTTYTFSIWLSSTVDPNKVNDTARYPVTAHYRAQAPDSLTVTGTYAQTTTVNVVNGVQMWYPSVYSSGRHTSSTCYWYTSPSAVTPFYRGNTYVTDVLYRDTTFYVRQKRELPMVRFTEVQFNKTGNGVTAPYPTWMSTNTAFAVELTNVGDYPADLEGDTLIMISTSATYNNKLYKFPRITLQPGENIVVQYTNGIAVDSSHTVGAMMTINPPISTPFALVYKDGRGAADVVSFNGMSARTGGTQWSSQRISTAVWADDGIDMSSASAAAGVVRTGWPTNASATPANSAQYWRPSTASRPMTMGVTDGNLIRYTDNGCTGEATPVHINLIGYPTVDIAVDSLVLPSGCGVGSVPITVRYTNYGRQTSGSFTTHFSVNGATVGTDNVPPIASNGSVIRTFSTPANLASPNGETTYRVKVWVDRISDDNTRGNDSTSATTVTIYTPAQPSVSSPVNVTYNTRTTLAPSTVVHDSLVWYDRNNNPVDTGLSYTTGYLYANDTFYVKGFAPVEDFYSVGNLEAFNAYNVYPSPYNTATQYGREQYIITADELRAAGHSAGKILSVSFYLENILVASGSVSYNNYKIYMGRTSQTSYSDGTWLPANVVYTSNSLTLTNSNYRQNWVKHTLDTPFEWDGVSNIVVGITRSQASTSYASGVQSRYTVTPTRRSLYLKGSAAAIIGDNPAAGSLSANRPDIRFGFSGFGCEGPTKQILINVSGTPTTDAAIEWAPSMDTTTFTSCGTTDFKVVVRNSGSASISGYTIDYWVDGTAGTYTSGAAVSPRSTREYTIASPLLVPGRHVLKAVVSISGDNYHTNDTITKMIYVRFCGGTYSMGSGASNQYHTFSEVVDTLNYVGVAGPVFFEMESGVFNERITLGAVLGSSATNTITFRSATHNASAVTLMSSPTLSTNYVLNIDGGQNYRFEDITIYAAGAGNYSNAVNLINAANIHFKKSTIRVKGSINNASASGIIIKGGVVGLYMDSCVVDSGFYSVKSNVAESGASSGMYFNDNIFRNFFSQGIVLRNVDGVSLRRNTVRSGTDFNVTRPLTGIYVAGHNGGILVERNNIVLYDKATGGKRALVLSNCHGTNGLRGKVINNMLVSHGTGVAGQSSVGIYIDSCTFMNIYYNTVKVYAGANMPSTRALSVDGTSASLYVINNILANYSRGHAYWLKSLATVATSNYNVYYSDSTISRIYNTKRLANIGNTEYNTIAALRGVTGQDGNSLYSRPYFQSDTNLHLEYGLYTEKAQYNSEVPADFDGEMRSQIPSPTIGADEYMRCVHNIAVMEMLSPCIDSSNIESDTLRVVVKLFNDGSSAESNVSWYADVLNASPAIVSAVRPISQILPGEVIYDTAYLAMPIGVLDTQTIQVHFDLVGDCKPENNIAETKIFLQPAFNIKAVSVAVTSTDGCNLVSAPVTITLANVGMKPIPTTYPIDISYQAILNTPNVTVAQLPLLHTERVSLSTPLPVSASTTFTFTTNANLYPTGNSKDISVKIRGWQTYANDSKHTGVGADTTSYLTMTSKYTPAAPVGVDLHIPYATWDTIHASQTEVFPGTTTPRPIRWYRDTVGGVPFFANSNYARSSWWETPQYFHDSTYYLNCISTTNCPSPYSPVHVILNPRVATDAALLSVYSPTDKVFLFDDTVKVRIINYGTQSISNIPVMYQLRRQGSGVILQEVTEICTRSIAPGATADFVFDTLVYLPEEGATYALKVWTDMASEMVRGNDTLREEYTFIALPENTYTSPNVGGDGMDIVKVSFNTLNVDMPSLRRTYTNAGLYDDPAILPVNLTRGTTDTMIIEVVDSENLLDTNTYGTVAVFVDYNRDGVFTNLGAQRGSELLFVDSIKTHKPYKFIYTVPNDALLGYMRMRVMAVQDSMPDQSIISATQRITAGHVVDFLLYIEDAPVSVDAALSRIISPTEQIVEGTDSTRITVALANKGATVLTTADISTRISNNDTTYTTTFTWTGSLAPGHSTSVTLPDAFYVIDGTTNVTITVSATGDGNSSNNVIRNQYHRFKVFTLTLEDNFEGLDNWFAPAGYNNYSVNLWERGVPRKLHITSSHSDSTVWATSISNQISTGEYGNLSYLYSPVINIAQIRPDTVSFWLSRAMVQGASAWLEFYNWEGQWVRVGSSADTLWYNDESGFIGTSSAYGYTKFLFPTSHISGDFQQRVQFRLVFKAYPGTADEDGVAVDDFRIGRARRSIDVGVVTISYPTHPQFGQTIRPRVIIKNFGYDTIYSINVAYRPYGTYLAKTGTYVGCIAPNETDFYTFPDAFTILSDFPDTFEICAYTTVNLDIYWDNDSCCKNFALSPLDHDMQMVSFISPHGQIVAGDSVTVTTRLRNFGAEPVATTDVVYVFNNSFVVTEQINFNDLLGHDLQPYEYINYTFRQKCRASMGHMDLTAYVNMVNDDYLYNDTINMTLQGISSVVDLQATAVVVDTTSFSTTRIQLTIDNVGAVAVNNFEVGFWYDNDISTLVRDTFRMGEPLAAMARAYYRFPTELPNRPFPGGYRAVTGFVNALNDNYRGNDTTSAIVSQYADLRAKRVLVAENRADTCFVRMELENIGNMAYDRQFMVYATVNGTSVSGAIVRRIDPGEVFTVDLNGTVRKNRERIYTGSGRIEAMGDRDITNNQTTIVDVQNYFDGIPLVRQQNGMKLDQNYPNPFDNSTRVDFYIPESGQVRFFVMDAYGRLVYQKFEEFAAGSNSVVFAQEGLSTGVYYYGIQMGDDQLMRKMIYKK
jgi:hypothetical protein